MQVCKSVLQMQGFANFKGHFTSESTEKLQNFNGYCLYYNLPLILVWTFLFVKQ